MFIEFSILTTIFVCLALFFVGCILFGIMKFTLSILPKIVSLPIVIFFAVIGFGINPIVGFFALIIGLKAIED